MKFISRWYHEFTNEIYRVRDNIASFTNLKQAFFVLLGIYVFSTVAIIRADVAYLDDVGRKAFGYSGWENFSRYLSNILSKVLHTSGYLGDISPLPQYLAIVFIIVASLIVIMAFKTDKKITIWDIIAVLPLGLSPYFLACLSFKYDAPYMALSVLGSILPVLFFHSKKGIYFAFTIIGILISCNTYQVSLGIFPMLVLFVSAKNFFADQDNKIICKKFLVSVIGYLLAIFVYKVFIMHPPIGEEYVNIAVFAFKDLAGGIVNNYKQYFSLLRDDFEPIYKIMVAYLCGCYVLQSGGYSNRNKLVSLLVAAMVLVVSALLMFGPYVVLTRPLFYARAMYGVGAYLAFISVICVNNVKFIKVSKVISLCFGWCFIVFTFLYGNALAEQDRYTHFRMEQTISTLTDLDDFQRDKVRFIQFVGKFGRSPIISNMPQTNYVLGRLIPDIPAVVPLGTFYLYHYYGLEKVEQILEGGEHILEDGNLSDEKLDLRKHNLPLIKETYYEKIYHKDNNWLIELK